MPCPSLVLREPIAETLPRWSKLSELVSNHLFGHVDRYMDLAVVNEEFEAAEWDKKQGRQQTSVKARFS